MFGKLAKDAKEKRSSPTLRVPNDSADSGFASFGKGRNILDYPNKSYGFDGVSSARSPEKNDSVPNGHSIVAEVDTEWRQGVRGLREDKPGLPGFVSRMGRFCSRDG